MHSNMRLVLVNVKLELYISNSDEIQPTYWWVRFSKWRFSFKTVIGHIRREPNMLVDSFAKYGLSCLLMSVYFNLIPDFAVNSLVEDDDIINTHLGTCLIGVCGSLSKSFSKKKKKSLGIRLWAKDSSERLEKMDLKIFVLKDTF